MTFNAASTAEERQESLIVDGGADSMVKIMRCTTPPLPGQAARSDAVEASGPVARLDGLVGRGT